MGWSQQYDHLVASCKDSAEYKLVFRTEEFTGDRHATIDNMTVISYGDTTKLYYMHYGNGMVSSLMIPFDIMDDLTQFEEDIISKACTSDDCEYSILIESGNKTVRIPIDAFLVESIPTLMLKLEE